MRKRNHFWDSHYDLVMVEYFLFLEIKRTEIQTTLRIAKWVAKGRESFWINAKIYPEGNVPKPLFDLS